MSTRHHLAIDIQGLLDNCKRRKITFMNHDDGSRMTDREARDYIAARQAEGHKLMSMSNECEGFDPFEKGCPGHPIEVKG